MDYSNTGLGTTSIAFIKLAGKNATAESPSLVIAPGKSSLKSIMSSYLKSM